MRFPNSGIFLLLVWPETAVGGLCSLMMRIISLRDRQQTGAECYTGRQPTTGILIRGVATGGGYIGIYTLPKSVPENYFVH